MNSEMIIHRFTVYAYENNFDMFIFVLCMWILIIYSMWIQHLLSNFPLQNKFVLHNLIFFQAAVIVWHANKNGTSDDSGDYKNVGNIYLQLNKFPSRLSEEN